MNALRRVLVWFAYQLVWLALPSTVWKAARFIVAKVELTPHKPYQKHALCFVKLRAQFPRLPKKVVSLAIEVAVYKWQ